MVDEAKNLGSSALGTIAGMEETTEKALVSGIGRVQRGVEMGGAIAGQY
jgi:hypothetical protein